VKPSQAEQSEAKLSRVKPSQAKAKREERGWKEERKEGRKGSKEGRKQAQDQAQLKPRVCDRIKHTCRARNSAEKVLVQSVSR